MGKKPTAAKPPAETRAAPRGGPPGAPSPLRYAHPFFTATPRPQRALSPATGTTDLAAFAFERLGPIPPPARAPVINLQDVIGAHGVAEIQAAGAIRLHAVGDTGRPGGVDTSQEDVVHAMASDYDPSAGGRNPALFVHLGDVIYGNDKEQRYRDQFYRPYMKYPGKIIAIPGNHDGETFRATDTVPLKAFLDNFCAPAAVVPEIAGEVRIFRETMTQPGVYWLLRCPFVNVIGLYSNIAEGPGNLLGQNKDDQQLKWLTATLASVKADGKALVIATHHPPYSSGGHSSSKDMLAQIDKACEDSGAFPDAMLAGHAHNYQRYTRSTKLGAAQVQIPCIVAGTGGHADSSVDEAQGQKVGDAVFEKSMKGFGYLLVTANPHQLAIAMYSTTDGTKTLFDSVTAPIGRRG